MEVIYSNDVINELMISGSSSGMSLYINKHTVLVSYFEKGDFFVILLDTTPLKHLSSEDLLQLLDSLSDNGRYEIIRSNPYSEKWHSIRIRNEELKSMIKKRTAANTNKKSPYYKGYRYMQEVLYMVCRGHILGGKVSVSDTIRKTAKIHRIAPELLTDSIHMALKHGRFTCNEKEYEDKDTLETFLRIISHRILDNVYFYTHVSEKIFGI